MSDINRIIRDCTRDYKLRQDRNKNGKSKYPTEEAYNNSFNNIIEFGKNIKDKNKIDTVIYNASNNDGLISGYIAWKALDKKPKMYGLKPSNDIRILDKLSNKYVLILDIAYERPVIEQIVKVVLNYVIIDDHKKFEYPRKFMGDGGHATVGYTWKFFYPNEPVGLVPMHIDDQDAKLFLPFISFSNFLTLAIQFRYTSNPYISRQVKESGEIFRKIDEEVFEQTSPDFWKIIGKYFTEVQENIKMQIAQNAKIVKFGGYNVGILNYNDPMNVKRIGRQINTNLHGQIDFAVIWGYEYTTQAYSIKLIDDHQQMRLNMNDIAKQLHAKGKHPKGYGGHQHIAHFYYPHDNNHSIWDFIK